MQDSKEILGSRRPVNITVSEKIFRVGQFQGDSFFEPKIYAQCSTLVIIEKCLDTIFAKISNTRIPRSLAISTSVI